MVTREHGSGPLSVDDVENGLIRIDSHTKVTKGRGWEVGGVSLLLVKQCFLNINNVRGYL